MSKRVLVTAGAVYGRLDDNKLVGNRIRGIWASRFAFYLHIRGFEVKLVIPDLMNRTDVEQDFRWHHDRVPVSQKPDLQKFEIAQHTGYESYAEFCYEQAPKVNAAVMAAAVVNWIPSKVFPGKMPTEGFREGDTQLIEFTLAPRVIDRMKKLNPKLALIGCKMTSGALPVDMLKAAYANLIKSHSNVVVANDLSNLKGKTLVYPDGSTFPLDLSNSFDPMYEQLLAVINDEHYRTERESESVPIDHLQVHAAEQRIDALLAKYSDGFVQRRDGVDRVFGGMAVRVNDTQFLVSPREKGSHWTSRDTVLVTALKDRVIYTVRGAKASLNAPVLIRHLQKYAKDGSAVLHQHRQLDDLQTAPYAPPGTVRDNERDILGRSYNIEGHGFVSLLNDDNLMLF